MDMASGRVKVEEVTMVTYGDGAAEVNRPWPLSWSAVWTGSLAAIAMILIFGLVGVAVAVRDVFDSSAVGGLADLLTARVADSPASAEGPRLVPWERPERVPLSFAQQRMWFVNRFAPESE